MIGNPGNDASRSLAVLFGRGTLGGLTDGQLLHRFAVRDGADSELAFAVLVERHGPMVLRTCRVIAGNSGENEDAFQATFLVLARKAGSLRVRDSLAPWLHQVAFRVASSARAARLRRQRHERLAARPGEPAVLDRPPDDLAPIIHEEIQALPAVYRSVVALCDLQGLTHAEAAERLGCPAGTVQSRLARGRRRLRDRLARRGLDPSAAVVAIAHGPGRVVPAPLLDSTARIATLLQSGNVAEIAAPGVARLFQDVTIKGGINMLKTPIAWLAMAAALAVADSGHAPRPGKANPASTGTASAAAIAADDDDRDDGPEQVLPRLDFGAIRVGDPGEIGYDFHLELDAGESPEMALKVAPPRFLRVEWVRASTRPFLGPRHRLIQFKLALDTDQVGDRAGRVKIEFGKHKVELPVRARILPADESRTKVLVIGQKLLQRPEYARPWLDLIESANVDVGYAELDGNLLSWRAPRIDLEGRQVVPDWLRRYDVVLLEDGSSPLGFLDVRILQDYVRGGGRLIVSASDSAARSMIDLVRPFGVALDDDLMNRAPADAPGLVHVSDVASSWVRPDPLTNGVESLVFLHPTSVRILEEDGLNTRRKYLIQEPDAPNRGLAAVVHDGGELIVIGQSIFSYQFSKPTEKGPDNARFLRNLLSRPKSTP